MVYHKYVKLPPLRLTQRCGGGVKVRCVHRGRVSAGLHEGPGLQAIEENEESDITQTFDESNVPHVPDEPSEHQLDCQASVRGWEKLRMEMLSSAIESSAMPVDQTCFLCSNLAVFRCQACGPLVYYCFECFSKQHEKVNIFHVAEKWEVV